MANNEFTLVNSTHDYSYDVKDLSCSRVVHADQTQSPKLNFGFTWKTVVRRWCYDWNHFVLFFTGHSQGVTTNFQFSEFSITGHRETIMNGLRGVPLHKDMKDNGIMKAEEELQRFVKFMGTYFDHNLICMRMEVVDDMNFVYLPRDYMDFMLQRSIEENVLRMTPATEESIKSLERKKVTEFGGDNCAVCLEEYLVDSEVVTMPCEHVFHGNCIQEWLKTSHRCPLCRFEMPTS